MRDAGITVNSWGGNPSTRYNYNIGHAWNSASDWEYRNGNYGTTGDVAGQFVSQAAATGVKVRLAVPTLGWVAKVGDFVGKSELVHAGGPTGTDVAVNWRVDRIRDGDVVFIREDPSHPEIPPTTRVVALRTPEEEAGQKAGNR